MPSFPFGRTVTLVRRVKSLVRDTDGNDLYVETTTDVPGCPVWPQGSGNAASTGETTASGDQVTTRYAVLFPPGTVISQVDAALLPWISDKRFEVVGMPEQFQSPFTGLDPGVLVTVRLATG